MTLTFEPLLPAAAWVILAVVGMGLWVWYILRRPAACSRSVWVSASALQGLGLAAVLLLLLNPIWLEPIPPPAGKPVLTILLDDSQSMATADVPGGQTRWQQATKVTQTLADEVRRTFDVRILRFDDKATPVDLSQLATRTPTGRLTDLANSIQEGISGEHPQGQALLLVSDGAHNTSVSADAVLDAAGLAKTRDAPIYVATVGTDELPPDLELRVPRSQELVFSGQSVPVLAELRPQGAVGDRASVQLLSGNAVLEEREVRLTPGQRSRVRFMVKPPGLGVFQYQLVVNTLPGEATDINNRAMFQARVVDRPVKGLVLEGKPYWDNKFLLRTLMEDPALEVDAIVRVAPDRWLWRRLSLGEENAQKATADASAETTVKKPFERRESIEFVSNVRSLLEDPSQLKDYQVILLGREAESYLTSQAVETLRDWVSRTGGALICYRGAPVAAPDQQLARILPVRWNASAVRENASHESRFRVQLTERGDDMSWLNVGTGEGLERLPSLAVSATTNSVKPLAVVLGRSDADRGTTPVLTYQPYGTGKVVVVEGSGMWRWAFLAPEYQAHDSTYGTLWQSLLRWLATSGGLFSGEDFALQLDRLNFSEGEPVSAIVLSRAETDQQTLPAVELHSREGELLRTVQPQPFGEDLGVHQVFLGELPRGGYEVRLTAPEGGEAVTKAVQFEVRPDLREDLQIAARPDLMQRVAELSGGDVLEPANVAGLADAFKEHQQRSRPAQTRRIPAWDRWWVLTGILMLWTTTWVLRRRSGLV